MGPLLSNTQLVHYLGMDNRTDPQYKLRMPADLRDRLKDAAQENHRTMNAEMVARLQESFSEGLSDDELLPADRAKEMSVTARKSIHGVVKKRILNAVNKAVTMGHSATYVDLNDLQLELLPQADQNAIINSLSDWLEDAGYEVEWDGPDSVSVRFDDW